MRLQESVLRMTAPDLALAGQDGPVQVGGDDRDLRALVRVGEGGHARCRHEARLQPVAAGGAVLQDDAGDLALDLRKEVHGRHHVPAQALARGFRAVAADADGIVVVDLHVVKAVLLQGADDAPAQVVLHPGVRHVPESAARRAEHLTVQVQKVLRLLVGGRGRADVLDLEPDAGLEALGVDGLDGLFHPLGEERPGGDVVAHADGPMDAVRLVPPAVDHKVGDTPAADGLQDLDDVLVRGARPRSCSIR